MKREVVFFKSEMLIDAYRTYMFAFPTYKFKGL